MKIRSTKLIVSGEGVVTVEPPFSPMDIPDLMVWYDFGALGDSLADGASVTSVADSSGNGHTATRVSGNQTYLADAINGKGGIAWSSGRMDTPSFQQWPSQAATWFIVAKHMADANEAMLMGTYSQGSSDWLLYSNSNPGGTKFFMNGQFKSVSFIDLAGVSNIQVWRRNGTALQLWLNGYHYVDFTLPAAQPTAGALALGDRSIGRSANVHSTDIFAYSRSITDDEILQATEGMSRKLYGGPPRAIVCNGDSITAGIGASSGRYQYPTQLQSKISGRYVRFNTGVGGYTVPVLIANAATSYNIANNYDFDSVFVGWGGSNDLVSNRSATDIFNDIQTWFGIMRANGFKYLVTCTILPRTDLTGPQEAERVALNGLILGNYASYADAVADTGNDPRMQHPENTTYYSGDGIHPNDAGHAIDAENIASAVNSLPA